MSKDILIKVQQDWKQPQPLKCMDKQAKGNPLELLANSIGKFLGKTGELAKLVAGSAIVSIPTTAALGAIVAQKAVSPKALAENADKYLLRNSLQTEVAYYRRKIAEETLRREINSRKEENKQYDRFVG